MTERLIVRDQEDSKTELGQWSRAKAPSAKEKKEGTWKSERWETGRRIHRMKRFLCYCMTTGNESKLSSRENKDGQDKTSEPKFNFRWKITAVQNKYTGIDVFFFFFFLTHISHFICCCCKLCALFVIICQIFPLYFDSIVFRNLHRLVCSKYFSSRFVCYS